jgi:hypothetical protein
MELLGGEHLGKAIDLAGRNARLFDANHVKALGIQELGRSQTRGKRHGQNTTRNNLKRHYLSLLKISAV